MFCSLVRFGIGLLTLLVICVLGERPSSAAEPSPFDFEQVAPWFAANGVALGVSDERTQGQASLSVRAHGYTSLSSGAFSFAQPTTSNLVTFDLRLPVEQPNPYWFGAAQVLITCPNSNLWNVFVGQTDLTGMGLGVFLQIALPIPSSVLDALRGGCPDLSVTVVLNVPSDATGEYLLDNMRLAAKVPVSPSGNAYPHYSFSTDAFGNVTEDWSSQQFKSLGGQPKLALVTREARATAIDGSITTTQPYTIRYSYDSAGRLTAASSASVTSSTTDAFGNVTQSTASQTFVVVAGQAKLGAVTTSTTTTAIDGSVTTTQPYTIRYSYDSVGKLTAASSASVTSSTTDAFGNVTQSTASQTFVVVAGQAKLGAVTTNTTTTAIDGSVTVTQPYTIQYSYDNAGKLTGASSATVTSSTTDVFGNVTQSSTSRSFTLVAGQAKLGAATTNTTTTAIDGSVTVTQPYAIQYSYNNAGKLTGASSATVTSSTTDAFGNVTQSTALQTFVVVAGQAKLGAATTSTTTTAIDGSVTTTQPYTIRYSYDSAGRLTGAPSANVISSTTDAFGNVTQSSTSQSFTLVAGQAKLGAVTTNTTTTAIDGSVTTTQPYTIQYSYDSGGKLTAASSATVISSTTDAFGNVTQSTTSQTFVVVAGQAKLGAATTSTTTTAIDGSVTTTQPYTILYSYDGSGRLTAASSVVLTSTTADSLGNLTQSSAPQTYSVVAGQAKLATATTSARATGIDGSVTITQPYTIRYSYDSAGRLTAASSVLITTVTTDAFGNVTQTTVRETFAIVNGKVIVISRT